MSDPDRYGFLSRWSRRKIEARENAAAPETPVDLESSAPGNETGEKGDVVAAAPQPVEPQPTPLPTLQDVQALTAESDFAPFMGRGVAPEVKNAAMKKLFADPHYNIMDGLDIYIDDYTQREVMPDSMLRKLAGSKILNLFKEDEDAPAAADSAPPSAASPAADTSPARTSAQAAEPTQSDQAVPPQAPAIQALAEPSPIASADQDAGRTPAAGSMIESK